MTAIINGDSPSVTFSDGTTQSTAFKGSAIAASPYTTSLGASTLVNNTGTANVAVGNSALANNTTASNNTAVGYQAGYTTTTGYGNVYFGQLAGQLNSTARYNTFIGTTAGQNTTGEFNTLIGAGAGYLITSGTKNSVLGGYNGNQGGLDIRTASNYIVLSDGDGNPRYYFNAGGSASLHRFSSSASTGTGFEAYGSGYATLAGALSFGLSYNQANLGDTLLTALAQTGYASPRLYCVANSGGVYLATGGTSWTSNSDERLKENLIPITDALNKVSTLRTVTGNYIEDSDKKSKAFLIAQDVQKVLPEAVDVANDEIGTLGVAYTDVIPLLVAAIKELNAKLEAQALEIATLKGN